MVLVAAVLVVCTSACTPAAQPSTPGGAVAVQAEARAAKTITIAIRREPSGLQRYLEGSLNSSASANAWWMVHDSLTIEDKGRGINVPSLAAELISVEKGTWRLNPDGTMDTTWRMHPNAKWHDGTPLTSADLLFAFNVYTDRAVPNSLGTGVRKMQAATMLDPLTITVHWSGIYINADEAPGLVPMPKHLLEELYLTDKANFTNSTRFTTDFVGVGPYRIAGWVPGSHMELSAVEDHWRGRPTIDAVVLRFINDPNTMLANILAGAVDVVLPPGPDIEAALEIRQRWEGTGHHVVTFTKPNITFMYVQFRPDYARPRNGLPVLPVRQGLYHAVDREAINQAVTQGLVPVADSWISPTDAMRSAVQASIPQYPYDPARAQQFLAQAGWLRGADGVLVHQPSGERFEIEVRARARDREKAAIAVASDWKAVGVQASTHTIPAALADDRSQEGAAPGALVAGAVTSALMTNRLHSNGMMGPENNWFGRNQGGYVNPRSDGIYDRLEEAIDVRERTRLHGELLREILGDLAVMPLYWEIEAVLALKQVKASAIRYDDAWNFLEWDVVP
jgi:peptide/nickel transport system substrate-binding protein